MSLIKFIQKNAIRGACMCGMCIDAPPNPEKHQPAGHTADVYFFKVSLRTDADHELLKKELVEHIKNHKGEFNEINLFDGKEHSYIEIGGWIGDQGLALTLMGIGELLGLWKINNPNALSKFFSPDIIRQMAGSGMVSITEKSRRSEGLSLKKQRVENV